MPTEHRVAANSQTKSLDLGCESAENWQLPSSFYRPTEGGRLSRPRHCSKRVQPVPKAVYSSDKHNRPRSDSNLPLTPLSDALTTRLLRPVTDHVIMCKNNVIHKTGSTTLPGDDRTTATAYTSKNWRRSGVWHRSHAREQTNTLRGQ